MPNPGTRKGEPCCMVESLHLTFSLKAWVTAISNAPPLTPVSSPRACRHTLDGILEVLFFQVSVFVALFTPRGMVYTEVFVLHDESIGLNSNFLDFQ